MKRLPAPDILIRQWLQNPHAITVAAFVIAAIFLGLAGWFIHRNLRHNEPGLSAPLALAISAAGVFGAWFRWTRDKANRHFYFSGDIGFGKTSGLNGLLAALIRRNPTLGEVVMANKGDEWLYLEWLAKKYGRTYDIIRLRPRLVGETGKPLRRLNVTGNVRLPKAPFGSGGTIYLGAGLGLGLSTHSFQYRFRMFGSHAQEHASGASGLTSASLPVA